MEQVRLSREELYELVWLTPMSKLARQYGISDVALAKACVRLSIPRPWRGYWAQQAAGQRSKRPRLPSARPRQPTFIELTKVNDPEPSTPRPKGFPVPVPEELSNASAAVLKLGRALRKADIDHFGRLVVPGDRTAVFATTVDTHRRALLILEALCRTAVGRGHTARFEASNNGAGHEHSEQTAAQFILDIEGEPISLVLEEKIIRRAYEPTADELAELKSGAVDGLPKTEQVASGRLELRFFDGRFGDPTRTRWSDWKTRRLENSLGEVLLAIEEVARKRKSSREAAARAQAEREEAERLRREEEVRQERLKRQIAELERMARDWRHARDLREFVSAVEAAAAQSPEACPPDIAGWITWARGHADHVDPLVPLKAPLSNAPERP